MRIYCFDKNKRTVVKLAAEDEDMRVVLLDLLRKGVNVRDAVAEEMFDSGLRRESRQLAHVFISL